MPKLRVSGSINAYGNRNAFTLLRDLQFVGGNLNIAHTGLTAFPSKHISTIEGNVLISCDASRSLIDDLERLKQNGIIKGEIVVYARGQEDAHLASQEEKFTAKTVFAVLCFGCWSAVQLVDSAENLRPDEEEEIDKSLEGDGLALVDLLGAYYAATTRVELYIRKIEYVTQKLGIPFIHLYRVVKIHEICHAVQHLGLDQRGDYVGVQQFNAIPGEILEPLAEYWTWIVASRLGSDGAIDAFFELDSRHPPIYRRWRKLNACHPEIVRMNWIRLRHSDQTNCTFSDLL